MERKIIVVGDSPATGGQVLAYGGPESTIHGHQVALIGGQASCALCGSVGVITKSGGLRRMKLHGAEVALEGDAVVCRCPVPPPLVSTLQSTSSYDDMGGG